MWSNFKTWLMTDKEFYNVVFEAVAKWCPGWSNDRIRKAIIEFSINGIKGDGLQVWHAIGNILWEGAKNKS